MPRPPPGLTLYPQFLTGDALDELRAHCRALPPPPAALGRRCFGDADDLEPVLPWMRKLGNTMFARGFFWEHPSLFRVTAGGAQSAWHIDGVRLGSETFVIALTDRRAIAWRPTRDARAEPYILQMDAGDGYLCGGAARWQWQHRVVSAGEERSFAIARR